MIAMPHLVGSLWYEIRRVAGAEPASRIVSTVQEMQPVLRSGPVPGWPSVFYSVGVSWIPAILALAWLLRLWPARSAVRLLVLWSAVMGIATVMQVRMAVYWLPAATVPAGVACAWLVHASRPALRRWVAAALGVVVLAVNLPWAIPHVHAEQGMNEDWLGAFTWLRENSPEPFSDAGVWSRYYAHGKSGDVRTPGGWGVAVWWDRGYALEELAHRIPMSNGTQAGAEEMARFYTETIPEAAVAWLRRSGARYVVVDPQAPLFAGENRSRFPVQIRMLGRNLDNYVQFLVERDSEGELKTRPVYLPTYYQTMAARLYLANGEAVDGAGPWVFETEPTSAGKGGTVELIVASRHFATEAEAAGYLAERRFARLTVGCLDPGKSCVALPAVKGLKCVFSSDPLPLSPKRAVRAVKIFQVTPE